MIRFKHFLEGNGLWANIHKKRKEGRPMRKPGSKGAPTKKDFDSARGEGVNEVINLDDADRDAQQYSNGSMSVKKIPSMIKKKGDKHLHLHMKSYHKEKDGQAFAKKHGYKVKNYVKTQSGTRMDLHKEGVEVDEKKSETWEAGYKRRVVKTTSDEHKKKGYNWRIKGKERPEISIKLYKDKPSQAEFNKQMRRVAGHEFGG